MTAPENPFLADLKSTVNVRLLDPLGKSIEGLKYQIMEGEKIVSKGITDAQGSIASFTSTIGKELTVHVERFANEEMKQVRKLIPWSNDFRVKLVSGKVKEKVVVKKDEGAPGNYKRKTYNVKKKDTLTSIAVQFGTTASVLARLNGLELTDTIFVDQILKLPAKATGASAPAAPGNPAPTSTTPASSAPGTAPAAPVGPAAPAGPDPASVPPAAAPPVTAPADAPASTGTVEEDSGSPDVTLPEELLANLQVEKSSDTSDPVGPATQVPVGNAPAQLAPAGESPAPPQTEAESAKPKVIPINVPIVTEIEEDRGENGTPKTTVKLACAEGTCIQLGQSSALIEEINIRLSGFGGTIQPGSPYTKFTEKTKKAVQQFQRDYMKVPATGKVCGAVLRAMDEFAERYPIPIDDMKCHCGVCGGFGRQYTSSAAVNFPRPPNNETVQGYEYPGMHRALLAAFRAVRFYVELEHSRLKYKFLHFSSVYRCWQDNTIHNPPDKKRRWTVNHMGNAMDIQFTYNGGPGRCAMPHTDTLRQEIFVEHIGAKIGFGGTNVFRLETAEQSAKSWVHIDCTKFDSQYQQPRHYAKTLGVADGTPMVTLAKNGGLLSLLNCGGIPATGNSASQPPNLAPVAPGGSGSGAAPATPPSAPTKKKAKKKKAPVKVKPIDPATVVPISGERKPIGMLSCSQHGLQFIKDFEKVFPKPYNDAKKNGFCTVGVGHLVDGLSTCEELDKKKSAKYLAVKNGIDDKKVDELFEEDLSVAIDEILLKCIHASLYQHEFDALVSLAFNSGSNFFKFKNLIGKLNKGDHAGCCSEFADITNNGNDGLVTRRKREMDMFTNSIYNAVH